VTTKEVIAAILILFGLMWLVSPILKWAVMGDSGSLAFAGVGAAFLIAGIVALKMWRE
jgi:hypothetical protein